jgi:hypothetical protein
MTPEELDKLNKQFERLKQLGTTLNKDLSKLNIRPVAEDAKVIEEILKSWSTEFEDSLRSVDSLSAGFKSVVQEISKGNIGINQTKKTFNTLSSIANKLSYQQAGINELSLKELKILRKKSEEEKINAQTNKTILEQRKKILDEQNKAFVTSIDQKEKNTKELENINSALEENESIIKNQNTQYKDLNNSLDEQIEKEKKIQKTLGLTGQAFKGIAKTLQNIGVESESIEEINTSMRKAAEEGKTLKVVTEGLKGSFKAIKESLLTDPAVQLAFLTKTFQTLYNIGINFSKDTANLARELGISSKNAATLNREFYSLTLSSKSAFGNQQNFLKATLELNESLGTSAVFSEKVLSTQAQISKVTGLTAEESADIYKLSLLNGKTQEEIYDSVGAIRKGNLNNKKVLQEVLKTSGQLAAQYKNNPKELGKAVVQAQKLGLTLEQTKNISKNLLNFEDSISAELEAELLTGKNLNLERARYLALMGDSAGAAEELMENLGPNGLEKFQKMNVIQQESYARALGMSADELADSLVKQKQLENLGKAERANLKKRTAELRKAGEYEKADQLEKLALKNEDVKLSEQQLDAQARIAQAADTFKSSIQAVIAGPLGYLADKVAKIMETISKSPFAKTVLGGIGSIAAVAAAASSVYLIGKTLVNSFKGRPSGRPGDPIFTTEGGIGGETGGGTSGVDLDSLGKGAKPASIGKQIKTLIKNPKAYMRALKMGGKLSKLAKVGGGITSLLGGVALDYAEQKQFEKAQKLKEQGKLEEANQAKNLGKVASVGSSTLTGAGIGGSIGALFGGIGAVPGAAIGGTLGAGYGALQNYLSDDTEPPAEDFIMQGGKMTRFRKDDVVVGGTNLGGGDNTEVVALLKELIITVKSGGNVYLDGTKVGTAMAMSTYKS